MQKEFGQNDPALANYAFEVFQPVDPVLEQVREACEQAGLPPIQVGAFDGLHLEVLMRLLNARKAVEIGSLGGYSAICMLRGMESGRLWTFELAPERAKLAEQHIALAGFAGQASVLVGPALDRLQDIEEHGPFDAVFIDADKNGYPRYLDWAAKHLRVGGCVIGDNSFGWGTVALAAEGLRREGSAGPPAGLSESEWRQAQSLHEFNRMAASGGRFRATILPTSEGLTVAVKVR